MTKEQVLQEHNKSFLAHDTLLNVQTWKGYDISNYSFTQIHKKTIVQCKTVGSILMVIPNTFVVHMKTTPFWCLCLYFVIIQDIWEFDYSLFRVPIFKCKQVNGNTSVKVDDMGFTLIDLTLIDLNRVAHSDEPFIMAEQAKQVFYV